MLQKNIDKKIAEFKSDSAALISELVELVNSYDLAQLEYCSEILPNSYRQAKLVPWVSIRKSETGELIEKVYLTYAKKAAYGSGSKLQVVAKNIDTAEKLKEQCGFRLRSKKDLTLTK
jgi:hypothetical protein